MIRFRFLGFLVVLGLVLGLSSCGNVVNEPAAEETGLETQEISKGDIFLSALEVVGNDGKCADVPRSTKRVGADLIQYDCNDQENQLFLFKYVDDEVSRFTVRSIASNLCMSVSPSETLGGDPVIEQTTCTGAPNQQFSLIYVSVENVGQFDIEAGRNSGRCLAINDKSRQNRAQLVAVDCEGPDGAAANSNRWNISNFGPAFTTEMIYEITGECADVPRFSKREGTDLIVYRCNDQPNQQFEFFKVGGSGTKLQSENFLIKGVDSGLCMTLSGTVAAGDRVIEQRECTGEVSQRFKLNLLGGKFDVLLEIDTPYTECLSTEPRNVADPIELRSGHSSAQDYDNLIPDVCDAPGRGYALWKLPGAKDAIIDSF